MSWKSTLLDDIEERKGEIVLLSWNIQGLRIRLSDHEFILHCSKFPILCFQETLLDTQDKPNIPGFSSFFRSNQNKRGGVAIYINDKIKDRVVEVKDIGNDNVLWVVAMTHRSSYCLATVYNCHDASKYQDINFYENLALDIATLSHRFKNPVFIVVGDFNARIASQTEFLEDEVEDNYSPSIHDVPAHFLPRKSCDGIINNQGRKMLNFCRESDLLVCNGRGTDPQGEITYLSSIGKSTIDYALVSPPLLLEKKVQFRVLDSLSTLHRPISLVLPFHAEKEEVHVARQSTRRLPPRIVLKTDKQKTEFSQRFMTYFPLFEPGMFSFLRDARTGDVAKKLTEFLRMVGRPFFVHSKPESNPSWYNKQHTVLKNTARVALRNYRKFRKLVFLRHYCIAKKEYRLAVRHSKREHIEKLKNNLKDAIKNNDSQRLWKCIKQKMGKTRVQRNNILPDDWVRHFRTTLCHSTIDRDEWNVDEELLTDVVELDRPITIPEVWQSIDKMKTGKAPGPSGITSTLIKTVKSQLSPFLCTFFNVILDSGAFPKEYTNALLFPIYKGSGSLNQPDYYRGIALLDHIGKLFTKIMNRRMTTWVDMNNLLDDSQGGFRRGRQTSDNALLIDTLVKEQLHTEGGRLYVAMIDKKKAFDFCSRSAILFRLSQLGVSKKVFRIVKSMFANSTFCIKINNLNVTQNTKSTSGIFQGCHWSPQLFILFLGGITESLRDVTSDSPELAGRILNHLLWADDHSLISKSVLGLQRLLDALHNFCHYWGIQVNISKTTVIIFKKGTRPNKHEKWFFNGKKIEVSHTARYLGFLFSSNGLWRQHKLLAVQNANRALIPLLSFYYRHRDFHGKFFRALYFSLVESIILYGSELWGVFYTDKDGEDTVSRLLTSLGMLDKPMLKFFKIFFGVPRSSVSAGILLEFGVNRTFSRVVPRAIRYWIKLAMLPNTHIMKSCLIKQRNMMENGMKPWLYFIKEILFSYGFGYVWENGFRDAKTFRKLFIARALEIHSASLISEAREHRSLEFYLTRKKLVCEIEPYTNRCIAERRIGAILRLNLKYALPWLPDNSFCKICNSSFIGDECWNHFLYDCTSLPPIETTTPRIPYPLCSVGIMSGRYPDLLKRMIFATTRVSPLEAEKLD